eukprot:2860835-Rhodomonas_salina.1
MVQPCRGRDVPKWMRTTPGPRRTRASPRERVVGDAEREVCGPDVLGVEGETLLGLDALALSQAERRAREGAGAEREPEVAQRKPQRPLLHRRPPAVV